MKKPRTRIKSPLAPPDVGQAMSSTRSLDRLVRSRLLISKFTRSREWSPGLGLRPERVGTSSEAGGLMQLWVARDSVGAGPARLANQCLTPLEERSGL